MIAIVKEYFICLDMYNPEVKETEINFTQFDNNSSIINIELHKNDDNLCNGTYLLRLYLVKKRRNKNCEDNGESFKETYFSDCLGELETDNIKVLFKSVNLFRYGKIRGELIYVKEKDKLTIGSFYFNISESKGTNGCIPEPPIPNPELEEILARLENLEKNIEEEDPIYISEKEEIIFTEDLDKALEKVVLFDQNNNLVLKPNKNLLTENAITNEITSNSIVLGDSESTGNNTLAIGYTKIDGGNSILAVGKGEASGNYGGFFGYNIKTLGTGAQVSFGIGNSSVSSIFYKILEINEDKIKLETEDVFETEQKIRFIFKNTVTESSVSAEYNILEIGEFLTLDRHAPALNSVYGILLFKGSYTQITLGTGNTATNANSIAIGRNSLTTGENAISIGYQAMAMHQNSVGINAETTEDNQVALPENTTIAGKKIADYIEENSPGTGTILLKNLENIITNDLVEESTNYNKSILLGKINTTNPTYSIAGGYDLNLTNAYASMIMGAYSELIGNYGFVHGMHNLGAGGGVQVAIGSGNSAVAGVSYDVIAVDVENRTMTLDGNLGLSKNHQIRQIYRAGVGKRTASAILTVFETEIDTNGNKVLIFEEGIILLPLEATYCVIHLNARHTQITMGVDNVATEEASISLGRGNLSTAKNGIAIGTNSQARHFSSVAIGVGVKTTEDNQVALPFNTLIGDLKILEEIAELKKNIITWEE